MPAVQLFGYGLRARATETVLSQNLRVARHDAQPKSVPLIQRLCEDHTLENRGSLALLTRSPFPP